MIDNVITSKAMCEYRELLEMGSSALLPVN
jgi:hypothetical protein